ncbi:hypothetical protein NR800_29060 [Corallococcus interemptor]|uniref:hypothetical protein n=1 Tax=Corallococcus interemptor TaxID=2316720 RepID=UPI0035D4564F
MAKKPTPTERDLQKMLEDPEVRAGYEEMEKELAALVRERPTRRPPAAKAKRAPVHARVPTVAR